MLLHLRTGNSNSFLQKIGEYEPLNTILNKDKNSVKVLGLKWIQNEDCFTFQAKLPIHTSQLSKRIILSEINRIFDPLGIISPITLRFKVLIASKNKLGPGIAYRQTNLGETL